jgi:hypothetical protein
MMRKGSKARTAERHGYDGSPDHKLFAWLMVAATIGTAERLNLEFPVSHDDPSSASETGSTGGKLDVSEGGSRQGTKRLALDHSFPLKVPATGLTRFHPFPPLRWPVARFGMSMRREIRAIGGGAVVRPRASLILLALLLIRP